MTLRRLLNNFAVSIVLLSVGAVTAAAQEASPSRGSAKVRPRFFNPFDVGGSRLAINPFGFFTFVGPTGTAADPIAPLDPVPAGSPAVSRTDDSGSSLAVGAGGVRPPFRPPVRSPFRPPPRPPF